MKISFRLFALITGVALISSCSSVKTVSTSSSKKVHETVSADTSTQWNSWTYSVESSTLESSQVKPETDINNISLTNGQESFNEEVELNGSYGNDAVVSAIKENKSRKVVTQIGEKLVGKKLNNRVNKIADKIASQSKSTPGGDVDNLLYWILVALLILIILTILRDILGGLYPLFILILLVLLIGHILHWW
ncbi:MAG: hypothetical protein GC181_03290 [Bacteroidetes bacterium]|nr:hypothetical protein [Bacteroidota bacterium]